MVKIDLVARTVTNDGTADISVTELITKVTKVAAGASMPLDPNTSAIKI